MIAIPALGLLVVLTRPGEARSTRRQWFAGDRPATALCRRGIRAAPPGCRRPVDLDLRERPLSVFENAWTTASGDGLVYATVKAPIFHWEPNDLAVWQSVEAAESAVNLGQGAQGTRDSSPLAVSA